MRASGRERQTLTLRYRRAGSVDFEFHRTGLCERRDKGTAVLKPCWWLGAESDEDEKSGDAYFVQEYVFEKSPGCSMHFRIGEGDWKLATVDESGECSKRCVASPKQMHIQKP